MRLSLLTAVHPPRAIFLEELAASVERAHAVLTEQGHRLEWVVCVDGPGDVPHVDAPGLVRIDRPMNGGVSAARNTALAHATGDLVMPLDHDDLADPEGLVALLADPRAATAAWLAGSPRLLDGSWTPHRVTEEHEYAPRELEEGWRIPFPFHPNVVAVRREIALAVGGWPALTASQDLGFALALNRHYAGWALPISLVGCRLWDAQTIAQAYYPALKALDFAFLGAHVNAERAQAGLGPVSVPTPGGSNVRASASTPESHDTYKPSIGH